MFTCYPCKMSFRNQLMLDRHNEEYHAQLPIRSTGDPLDTPASTIVAEEAVSSFASDAGSSADLGNSSDSGTTDFGGGDSGGGGASSDW